MAKEYITEDETARILGVSKPVLWRLRKEGALRFFRLGKRLIRYERGEVEAYMEERAGMPMEVPTPPTPLPLTRG